jgi:hypothetical protein
LGATNGENMYRALLLTAAIAVLLPACRSREDAGASDSAADTAAMTGMAGMSGGQMMSHMMDSMEVHMRMMDTASAPTMQAMMPMHHQMADSMISRMDEDMRRMNMATDSAWTATLDSLRQDMGRMSAMTASEMMAMMPAHRARMMRLMQMHRTMTGKNPK